MISDSFSEKEHEPLSELGCEAAGGVHRDGGVDMCEDCEGTPE